MPVAYSTAFHDYRLTLRAALSRRNPLATSSETNLQKDRQHGRTYHYARAIWSDRRFGFGKRRSHLGRGFGAEGAAVGEVCFNTAMTGYQEVMTDPSYARQIINFTFPHIGNVGTNREDVEANNPHALGAIVRQDMTDPSNFRTPSILMRG